MPLSLRVLFLLLPREIGLDERYFPNQTLKMKNKNSLLNDGSKQASKKASIQLSKMKQK